ncbi:NERD domain-containing protein [Ramlibacter sp. XY19]|uniref:DEAD/DEAH box helicase n=1 Tax=Ramlibacter paludis TaxID=2908000 RepID=UPI0023DAC4B7|nr:3'-5' exonuclease [Ramlibacter paludis]MCG2594582.1 NERD domain-containing protein [Ramlibacter paludis]
MTSGERRLAERLEQKLDHDYLIWYDVPVGPMRTHPDFVVIHPQRGILILETKDWKLETIVKASRQAWDIAPDGQHKVVKNPLEQARHGAIQVVRALEQDVQLIQQDGPHKGKLAFPWGHGVVFTNITRKQFTDAGLHQAIDPHYAICKDEMLESAEVEEFQQRLWQMFPHSFGSAMSPTQLERVRWIMFPEVRIPSQSGLFTEDGQDDLPDMMRVMDLQQEQLARSLGDGHRVIHGVAGSGKTMILGYRAEHLAKCPSTKPILVLCYNKPLSQKLEATFAAKGLAERVHVRNFHKWCRDQLVDHKQPVPEGFGDKVMKAIVDNVISGVAKSQIPSGQYQAVLIDEGHDFHPEWLKLATQMVDPETNSVLVLYDSAQDIYGKSKDRGFSFKSVGIQAAGRTTILRINYRNTRQILQTASVVAAKFLSPQEQDDDGVPVVKPLSCGRDGQQPLIIRLSSVAAEPSKIAEVLASAHEDGHPWGDMAVLCRKTTQLAEIGQALKARKLPHQVRTKSGGYDPRADSIKVMTMHGSKGLEFPVVALCGVGQMPGAGEDEKEEARLFYVAATRAMQKLAIAACDTGKLIEEISSA